MESKADYKPPEKQVFVEKKTIFSSLVSILKFFSIPFVFLQKKLIYFNGELKKEKQFKYWLTRENKRRRRAVRLNDEF